MTARKHARKARPRKLRPDRKLEQALVLEQQRLALVVRATRAGILDWDIVKDRIWFSKRYKQLLGYAKDADTTAWINVFDFIYEGDRERARAAFVAELKGDGRPNAVTLHQPLEFRMRRADGRLIWVQSLGLTQRDRKGRSKRYLAALTDITDRHTQEERLRDQVALTEAIVAQVPNAIFVKDSQGRFTLTNPAWSEMSGVPRERALGKTAHDIYPPAMAQRFSEEDAKLVAQGTAAAPIESVHHGPRPDQYRIVRKRVLTRDKEVLGLVCTSTDVSELKRIEAELRDQMVLTRALFDDNPNAMYVKDTQGRYVTVNDAWLKMVGITREQAIGHTVLELFPEKESGRYHAEDMRLIAQGDGSSEMESLRTGPDAMPHWVIIRKRVLRRTDGTLLGLIGTNTDITRLKLYEQQLAEERLRLDMVVHGGRVGIVDWDGRTHATYYSPIFREILGYPRDADTSQWPDYFKVLLHPDDRERFTRRWQAFIRGQGPEGPRGEYLSPDEHRLLRADGTYVWVQVSGIAVRDERGFTTRWIGATTDISERKRLFREIEEKSAQLEIANKHKSDFLANMSHELRTPLNAIIGFSEALMDRMFGDVNDKQADYLKDIHESGRHLLSLINDILDLSKIEAGRMDLESSRFHLPTAISNAMTLIRERATRHGITLGTEVDEQLGEFQADERKFKQILLNLLSNAVKFTPDGGRIDVSAKLDTTKVSIAVKDTGIGIAPEDQAAVFEEFKQVGRDYTRKVEGTGLGLALTRRFIELHGGEISLASELGKGSTFTFTLPVRQ